MPAMIRRRPDSGPRRPSFDGSHGAAWGQACRSAGVVVATGRRRPVGRHRRDRRALGVAWGGAGDPGRWPRLSSLSRLPDRHGAGRRGGGTRAAGWLPGFALAIANPKVYAAIGAVFSGHTLIADQATPDAVAKLTVLVVLMLLVHAAWWLFGAALAQQMRDPRRGRRFNLVFAAALVLSIILALV